MAERGVRVTGSFRDRAGLGRTGWNMAANEKEAELDLE
jgi:hypothetical protein